MQNAKICQNSVQNMQSLSFLLFSTNMNSCFFGGYDNSQRKIFAVFPQWHDIDFALFPICVLKIVKTYDKQLSHRDYLGTLLSGGIDRSCIGDILVCDDGAYVYILSNISDYLCSNIDKISNVGVKMSIENALDIVPPEPKFEIINTVCASLRLDAVISAMLNISRNSSSSLIKSQKVSVNHIPNDDVNIKLKPDDIISVRGYGRFIFVETLGETKSKRIHIKLKKFI